MGRRTIGRLSAKALEKLKAGQCAWDGDLSGYGARKLASGRITLLVRYRNGRGQQRYVTIGALGAPWSLEAGRKRAKVLLAAAQLGQDPAAERQRQKGATTVAELADRYLRTHATPKKKPRSAKGDEINLRRHILPRIGKLSLEGLHRREIIRLHQDMADMPATANRCLALLSKMMRLAESWGELDGASRLVAGIEKYPEKPRERFLEGSEGLRLMGTLDEMEPDIGPHTASLFRLLLLTGARLSELLQAKWSEVDLSNRILILHDSKTGPRNIHLNSDALSVLKRVPELEGNPYIFAGRRPGRPLVGVQKVWQRIRTRAGLNDLRVHDLRHSFASTLVRRGVSLPQIGGLLGHKQFSTTQRYAHISASTLADTAELAGISAYRK